MKVSFKSITPWKALELLEHNVNNRPINKNRVKMYADDMRNGGWFENGESIVITESGNLVDGQHRLMALVEANVTATFVVATIPDKNARNFDNGRSRNTNDALRMYFPDKTFKRDTVSACKMVYRSITKRRAFSESEIIDFIVMNYELVSDFQENVKTVKFGASVTAGALCAYKNGYDVDKLNRFIEVLNNGYSVCDAETIAVALRNYLISHTKENGAVGALDKFLKTQRALYIYQMGFKTRKFSSDDTKIYYPWD